jgi:hypothetical protein
MRKVLIAIGVGIVMGSGGIPIVGEAQEAGVVRDGTLAAVIIWRDRDAMSTAHQLMRAQAAPMAIVSHAACAVPSGTPVIQVNKGFTSGLTQTAEIVVLRGSYAGCRGVVPLEQFIQSAMSGRK